MDILQLYAALGIISLVCFALWIGARTYSADDNLESYALGSKNYSTFVLASTLFATEAGSYILIAKPEKAFTHGFAIMIRSIALLGLIFTAMIVLPNKKRFPNVLSAGDIGAALYGNFAKILFGFIWVILGVGIIISELVVLQRIVIELAGAQGMIFMLVGLLSMLSYCYLGGIKAVVKTDVIQSLFVILVIPIVIYFVVKNMGGFSAVWPEFVAKSFSLKGDWDADLLIKFSFYAPLNFLCLPITMQRFYLGSKKNVYKAVYWNIGITVVVCFIGACMAVLLNIQNDGQMGPGGLIPLIVQNLTSNFFKVFILIAIVAAIFAALDSYLNSVSLAFVRDLVQPISKLMNKKNEINGLQWAKKSVIIAGIFSFIGAFYVTSIHDFVAGLGCMWPSLAAIPIAAAYLGRALTVNAFKMYTFLMIGVIFFVRIGLSAMGIKVDVLGQLAYIGFTALPTYSVFYYFAGKNLNKKSEDDDNLLNMAA